jgi:hypothetical protein
MMRTLALLLLLVSAPAWADIKVHWESGKDRQSLRINLAESLTEQQKKLLYSGFSTFSHLEVRWIDNDVRRTLVFISECTIKFDLWEEKFALLHFLELRKENSLKSFQQYTDLCLQADISNQSNIAQIASRGARLDVRLDISQVSNEFAQDVRSWLIQQQSGVMRGLFSHMLGDLKLSESTQTILVVPPLVKGADRG